MDGVITELTLTDALFEGIEALYKEVTDESGMPYTSIAINQAELMIYLEKSDYPIPPSPKTFISGLQMRFG